MAGVLLQALDERSGKWMDLPFGSEELGEVLCCVVCTEPYYGGDSTRLPHETCIHGHTCCVECYARLTRGAAHSVTCPMCRTATMTSRLRVLGETDGLLGMLVLRNRLRWACAARCGFSGRLATVRAHSAKCARALVQCAMCDAHVSRSAAVSHMLAAHAHSTVRVRSARAIALSLAAPRVLLLPLGVTVVARPVAGGVALSVMLGGMCAQDRLVELELALYREGTSECTCVDVLALARAGGAVIAVAAANRASVTCRVPLYTVPAFGVVRVGGVAAVHVVGEALGESVLAPTKPGCAPYAMASNVFVGIVEARVNERCWVREEGTGMCKIGTVVRYTDGTAIVRTADTIVEAPRVLCGAIRAQTRTQNASS
jgi:hypothetical protein